MGFRAFNQCVSIIALNKNNINYGMTCAWATQIDYDKVGCLMGAQSVTAKVLTVGDYIGVSALASDQINVAIRLGDNHSDEMDKFKDIDYANTNGAITINNAKAIMTGKVLQIIHLDGLEDDYFVTIEVTKFISNEDKKYLLMGDIR